jgi:hypothetical protein
VRVTRTRKEKGSGVMQMVRQHSAVSLTSLSHSADTCKRQVLMAKTPNLTTKTRTSTLTLTRTTFTTPSSRNKSSPPFVAPSSVPIRFVPPFSSFPPIHFPA